MEGAKAIPDDRVYLLKPGELDHVRERVSKQHISGVRVESVFTDHCGPTGKPYRQERAVAVCDACGKVRRVASVNRRGAVTLREARYCGVPDEERCECLLDD